MSSKIFILIAGLFVGIAVDRVLLQLSDYGSRRLQQRSEGVRRAICHQRVDRLEMEVENLRMHPRNSTSLAVLPTTVDYTDLWLSLMESIESHKLNVLAEAKRREYKFAKPFPHTVIDDLFPTKVLEVIQQENPEDCARLDADGGFGRCDPFPKSTGCVKGSTQCFSKEKRGKGRNREYRKSTKDKDSKLPPVSRMLMAAMKASSFVAFLELLSGVEALIPDPHLTGAGLHFTSTGGLLAVHADFNKLPRYRLDRRVNVFVFLNDEWPESYGGHLELWDRNVTRCVARIAPTFGRVVVFSTTDFSFHGHPARLAAPPERVRRSIAMYYYTNGRPGEECLNGDCSGENHNTIWKQLPKTCAHCVDEPCRAFDT